MRVGLRPARGNTTRRVTAHDGGRVGGAAPPQATVLRHRANGSGFGQKGIDARFLLNGNHVQFRRCSRETWCLNDHDLNLLLSREKRDQKAHNESAAILLHTEARHMIDMSAAQSQYVEVRDVVDESELYT